MRRNFVAVSRTAVAAQRTVVSPSRHRLTRALRSTTLAWTARGAEASTSRSRRRSPRAPSTSPRRISPRRRNREQFYIDASNGGRVMIFAGDSAQRAHVRGRLRRAHRHPRSMSPTIREQRRERGPRQPRPALRPRLVQVAQLLHRADAGLALQPPAHDGDPARSHPDRAIVNVTRSTTRRAAIRNSAAAPGASTCSIRTGCSSGSGARRADDAVTVSGKRRSSYATPPVADHAHRPSGRR